MGDERYPWRVQLCLEPLVEPTDFKCKRIQLAYGDSASFVYGVPKPNAIWNENDYLTFTRQVAGWVLNQDYENLNNSMHPRLQAKKTADALAAKFQKLTRHREAKKLRDELLSMPSDKRHDTRLVYSDIAGDALPHSVGQLDPDTVRAVLFSECDGLFRLELVLVSLQDQLLIGKIKLDEPW